MTRVETAGEEERASSDEEARRDDDVEMEARDEGPARRVGMDRMAADER